MILSNYKYVLFCLFICSAFSLKAQRFIEYKKGQELNIKVGYVSKDLSIDFNEKVTLGTPTGFKLYFRPQLVGSVLYLKAIKKTEKQFRVLVKNEKNVFVLNVQQDDKGNNEPIIITKPNKKSRNNAFSKTKKVSDIELVRFISQQLYAPHFAQEPLLSVKMVPHHLPNELDWLYKSGGVHLNPIISFKAGDITVTALRVTNKSKLRSVALDMSNFYGRIMAQNATPQHKILGIKEENNVTAIYLVTKGSLAENIKIKGYL